MEAFMKLRNLTIFLILCVISCFLFGCTEEKQEETKDPSIINSGVYRIGLLTDDDNTSNLTEQGFTYANSLANKVNIDEVVEIQTSVITLDTEADASECANKLIDEGISAVVINTANESAFDSACSVFENENIAVISISPFEYESDNVFKLNLNDEYIASCALTYAKEQGYSKTAVLLESDSENNKSFERTYRSTHKAYLDSEPTVYYLSGDSKNYTADAVVAGNYDLIFISDRNNQESVISELRQKGYSGAIMLPEMLDKSLYLKDTYNNCYAISKSEYDISNNISTVFYTQFSEHTGVSCEDVSAASAYGYDAYMVIFESLKSFSKFDNSSIFNNTSTTETSAVSKSDEILSSDFISALKGVSYHGVTDTITFINNNTSPTYIYVDYILNSNVFTDNKYVFNKTN